MADQELLIRSARAAEIAGRLAERERKTVDEIVEAALERYDASAPNNLSPREFYASLRAAPGDDVDLMAIINEARMPQRAIDL